MGFLSDPRLVASFPTLSGSPPFKRSRYPFADRVAAAAKAGFYGIGLTVDDVDGIGASGISPLAMVDVLAEHDVRVTDLGGIASWPDDGRAASLSRDDEERL